MSTPGIPSQKLCLTKVAIGHFRHLIVHASAPLHFQTGVGTYACVAICIKKQTAICIKKQTAICIKKQDLVQFYMRCFLLTLKTEVFEGRVGGKHLRESTYSKTL